MFAVDRTPHISRPSMPTTKARLTLAAAMHFLAVMVDRDPTIDNLQEDTDESLLPPSMIGELAKDFMYAKRDTEGQAQSYFFEQERFTFLTALKYLDDLIDSVGTHELMASLQGSKRFGKANVFSYHGTELMDRKEIHKLFHDISHGISLDQLHLNPTLHSPTKKPFKSPYKGNTYQGEWMEHDENKTAPSPGM